MLCCCHVPMKPGCSALGGLVLNCMELSPAPSVLLLMMLMSPRQLLLPLLFLVLLLLWLLEGMHVQTMPVGPSASAGGGLGVSGSVLVSCGTVSHSLPFTSNSASLDLERRRDREGGQEGCGSVKEERRRKSQGRWVLLGSCCLVFVYCRSCFSSRNEQMCVRLLGSPGCGCVCVCVYVELIPQKREKRGLAVNFLRDHVLDRAR